jgi:hypothetical protein
MIGRKWARAGSLLVVIEEDRESTGGYISLSLSTNAS